jgi:hypothetical protein
MFTPIRTTAALPPPGRTNERFYVDFKAEPTADAFENAKDVASFANGDGGTILIGAKGSGEFLANYKPLDQKTASDAQRAIDQAVRDRCAPVPLFDVTPIEKDGGFVLAVNVWPFPGQVVGVELKKGEAKCGAKQTEPQGVYFFPRRVGAQTTSIRPEQIPMFMDARVRRHAIMLQQAIGQKIVIIDVRAPHSGEDSGMALDAVQLDSIDLTANTWTITLQRALPKPVQIGLPLDAIESVWREGEIWRAGIRGRLRQMQWMPGLNEPALQGITFHFDMRG